MKFRHIKFMPLLAVMILPALLAAGCAAAEPASNSPSETVLLPVQPTDAPPMVVIHTPPAEPPPTPTAAPGIDMAELSNMTYRLDIVSQALPGRDGSVILSGGHFEELYPDSAVGVVVNLIDHTTGDLNADGLEDAIALLAINTGGTGTFIHLAAVIQQAGGLTHTATLLLGDRVQVESLDIADGTLQVQMVTHAPDDPLCCPTEQVTQSYTLQEGMLVTPEQSQVLPLAEAAIQALSTGDMAELASLVHPEAGLRFSPYAYVLPEHLAFSSDQLPDLLDDPTYYTWGAFDGSGEPIRMTFAEYFDRFVYSKDFAGAKQVSLDRRLGAGNTLDNSHEFYPGAIVVEYYLPGENPDYGGLDWQSLRLVFEQQDGVWYLAGIIHDEWTI